MLIFPSGVKIHLALGYTDMRKGFDSLTVLERQHTIGAVDEALENLDRLDARPVGPALIEERLDLRRLLRRRKKHERRVIVDDQEAARGAFQPRPGSEKQMAPAATARAKMWYDQLTAGGAWGRQSLIDAQST
jgi:hypothetical protein